MTAEDDVSSTVGFWKPRGSRLRPQTTLCRTAKIRSAWLRLAALVRGTRSRVPGECSEAERDPGPSERSAKHSKPDRPAPHLSSEYPDARASRSYCSWTP